MFYNVLKAYCDITRPLTCSKSREFFKENNSREGSGTIAIKGDFFPRIVDHRVDSMVWDSTRVWTRNLRYSLLEVRI